MASDACPNKLPAVDAAIALLLHVAHDWRGTAEGQNVAMNLRVK